MKNSNDNIWNRTSDLPACSAMPQPTAPLRVPKDKKKKRRRRKYFVVLQ